MLLDQEYTFRQYGLSQWKEGFIEGYKSGSGEGCIEGTIRVCRNEMHLGGEAIIRRIMETDTLSREDAESFGRTFSVEYAYSCLFFH